MLTAEDINRLPDDPALAFAAIVDLLDEYCDAAERNEQLGIREANQCAEDVYAHLTATDTEQNYPRLAGRPPQEPAAFWAWWHEFRAALHFYRTLTRMKLKTAPLTVVLDKDHRKQIHSLLNKVRTYVPKLDITIRKRDAIVGLIARLESEVDRERTYTESLWALIMEGGGALGKAGKDAEPFIEGLERIKKVFFEAKAQDIPPQLPPPEPRKQLPAPDNRSRSDNDIPF